MADTVFLKFEFYLLIAVTLILPIGIYVHLLRTEAISKFSVLLFAALLIVLAGASFFLLHQLSDLARISLATLDDGVFSSGLTISLYLLPATLVGVGVNMISHILISHLSAAERRFDRQQSEGRAREEHQTLGGPHP
ncbi:MAG: hypothetical protein SF172_11800 [Burkholderiales bacterium]|nr:hypothetical protein [Burkholderiales bacterium]